MKVAVSKPVPPLLYKSKAAECDFSNMSIDIFDDCQTAVIVIIVRNLSFYSGRYC